MKSLLLTLANLSVITTAPFNNQAPVENTSNDNTSRYSDQEFNQLKESLKNVLQTKFKNESTSIVGEIQQITNTDNKNTVHQQLNHHIKEFLKTIVGNLIFKQNNNTFNNSELERELKNQIDTANIINANKLTEQINNIFKNLGQKWIDEERQTFSFEELNKDLAKSKWTIKQENIVKYKYFANQARQIFSNFYVDETSDNNSWYLNDTHERTDQEAQNIYYQNAIEPKLYLLNEDSQLAHNQKSKKLKNNDELETLKQKLNLSDLNTYKNFLNAYGKYFKDEFYRYHENLDYSFKEIWTINPAVVFINEDFVDSQSVPTENVTDIIKNYYLEDVEHLLNNKINKNDINWNNHIDYNFHLNENATKIYNFIAKPLIQYLKDNILNDLLNNPKINNQDKTRILNLLNAPVQETHLLIDTVGIYKSSEKDLAKSTVPKVAFFNLKLKVQQVLNEIGKIIKPELNNNPDLNFYNYTFNDLNQEKIKKSFDDAYETLKNSATNEQIKKALEQELKQYKDIRDNQSSTYEQIIQATEDLRNSGLDNKITQTNTQKNEYEQQLKQVFDDTKLTQKFGNDENAKTKYKQDIEQAKRELQNVLDSQDSSLDNLRDAYEAAKDKIQDLNSDTETIHNDAVTKYKETLKATKSKNNSITKPEENQIKKELEDTISTNTIENNNIDSTPTNELRQKTKTLKNAIEQANQKINQLNTQETKKTKQNTQNDKETSTIPNNNSSSTINNINQQDSHIKDESKQKIESSNSNKKEAQNNFDKEYHSILNTIEDDDKYSIIKNAVINKLADQKKIRDDTNSTTQQINDATTNLHKDTAIQTINAAKDTLNNLISKENELTKLKETTYKNYKEIQNYIDTEIKKSSYKSITEKDALNIDKYTSKIENIEKLKKEADKKRKNTDNKIKEYNKLKIFIGVFTSLSLILILSAFGFKKWKQKHKIKKENK
ncbi:hypothetical protein [Mycoplasma miroungirhinis]|uniref:Uncharacterized protein n=1 Tax=Mycoplasma miroungirhinis TaxID=754516 RepID=A0A6M4JBC7_9MOLU|nr:hypothetical protein [Mycoplasma miroungirhinis]QJR44303.1 hypothetical protein HLA92_02580 [Mycoplasma miroungirhinis]